MNKSLRFLIIDGYPKASRNQFESVGMVLAGKLYANLLLRHLPTAKFDIYYSSDARVELPDRISLQKYDGILWPGCNLTVYHDFDERVTKMVNLAKRGYEVGIPQFGSCWAAQIAVYAAGGEVKTNPKGREMGVARKIYLTDEGKNHPMFDGKPFVFDHLISHDDEITKLPPGTIRLAGNDFTHVQAVSVEHKKGVFWATQYHPEYNLHDIARLIVAREEKLTREGYFQNHEDVANFVERLEIIYKNPTRKDLRWQHNIDYDVLTDSIRECEFVNWLNKQVINAG